MAERSKLLTQDGYTSYRIDNAGIPTAIIVTPDHHPDLDPPTLQCNLDAADSMSFCNIPARTAPTAILCLTDTLKKHYGGKNMFSAPQPLVSALKTFDIYDRPEASDKTPYPNLMQADLSAIRKKFTGDDADIKSEKYTFITDKQVLMGKTDEISALFLKTYEDKKPNGDRKANAEFASRENKRNYYSPSAMKARLDDPHVNAVAVATQNGKIVGFIRSYSEPGVGTYVSDMMVDRAHEGIMLSRGLMREGLALLHATDEKLFLIAGEEKEILQYKRLGFASVSKSPVEFPDNRQFMFGRFKPMGILINLGEQLGKDLKMPDPVPAPPKRSL